jgi:sugar diacid utilization regulator
VEARIGYTVVDALIRGDVPEEDLVERARLLGFDPDSSYVVAIVSLVDSTKRGRRWVLSDRHDYYRRERAGQVARHLLEQERLPVLCTYSLNQIVCLLPANPRAGEQEWLRRVAGALYQQLAAADDVPPVILTLGKAHAGLAGVMRSHWESDRALSLASGDEGVLFFEDLTLANLLAQVSERDSLEAMYARTLGPLLMSAKGRVLKETLWALVAAGFNQEEAAAAMGIHRNTMRGRLLRVQDILARPLTDPTLRRDLGVVKEIERLLGSQVAARLS